MASLEGDKSLHPSVEIMRMQRNKIRECEQAIYHDIVDEDQSCAHVNGLLHQLKYLYKMHFMYEEQVLEEVNLPSVAEHKNIHEVFLTSLDHLTTDDSQCHSSSYVTDFINMRLDFAANVNKETMMICDFTIKAYGRATTETSR